MAATETAPDAPADGTATTEPDVATTAPDSTESGDMVAGTEADVQYELATQELTAGELMGSAVYGTNDENLGEVGDVIFADSGDIEAVVVDVGGFLGVGEKPVAVQFDALNVQKDTNGDLQLMVNATQEQLEAAPTYDVEEETAQ